MANRMDAIKPYTILVVEDNDPINRLFCRYFTASGYVCRGVTTIEEALHLLQTLIPDLLVLDFELPDGYGTRILDELNARNWQIPTIVVSASPHVLHIKHYRQYHINHILVKPISPVYMSHLVTQTLSAMP